MFRAQYHLFCFSSTPVLTNPPTGALPFHSKVSKLMFIRKTHLWYQLPTFGMQENFHA
jgi:hypothetical protein